MRFYDRRKHIFAIICHCQGAVLWRRSVQLPAFIAACFGGVAAYLQDHSQIHFDAFTDLDLHTYTTLLVSLLLVFRTNASYEAYKESIVAFNSMITSSHDLGTQICSYVEKGCGDRCGLRQMMRLTVLMCVTIKQHIKEQNEEGLGELFRDGLITKHERNMLQQVHQRPFVVAFWMRLQLKELLKSGALADPITLLILDNSITRYLEHYQSVCFHRFVPVPFQYAQLMKLILLVYTCVAPFAFCSNFFRFTPIGAWALAVLVFSVDTIGSAIECPFGDDPEVDVDVEGALNQCLDVMETWSSGTVSEVMTEESKFHTRRNSLNPNNDTENDSNHVGEKVCRDKKSHPGGFFQARSIRADWDQTVDEPTPVHSKSATSARDMAGVELSDMNFDHDRRRSHSAVTAERSGSALGAEQNTRFLQSTGCGNGLSLQRRLGVLMMKRAQLLKTNVLLFLLRKGLESSLEMLIMTAYEL